MSRKFLVGGVGMLCAPLVLAFITLPLAWADPDGCTTCSSGSSGGSGVFGLGLFGDGSCCQHTHCPPPFVHCQEKQPCIKYKHGCPRPVCNPCELQHFGYYETCWHPWPFAPDWSHCTAPPYAARVPYCCPQQQGMVPGATVPERNTTPIDPDRVLPPARKLGGL